MVNNNKPTLKDILVLQLVFVIYSFSSVVAKLASAQMSSLGSVFDIRFILLALLDVIILGVYALLWQQVIKKWELSIAYANKGMTLFWGLLWGGLIFNEAITAQKVLGIFVVFLGVVIMNGEKVAQA
ncbi:MAG: transporter [Lachnospiraceae bacterium]|jgi:drug/metabolite transporter (DMT)-like permease|nr:transporter [Lachnospiraceae bacterium]